MPKKTKKRKRRTGIERQDIGMKKMGIQPLRVKIISDLRFLKDLNKRRKEEYEEWRTKRRMLEKIISKSTLIIGINARDSVILAADRKVIRGGESDFEEKIRVFNITESGSPIVLAAAGYLGVTEDFVELFQQSLEENVNQGAINSILSVKFLAEDILMDFEERYGPRLEAYPIKFIFGGLEQLSRGNARLYMIGPRGYGEKIRFCRLIGHGSPYARTIARFLLDRKKLASLSIEELSQRAYACIKWIADGVDDYVGGEPQIMVLQDNDPIIHNLTIERSEWEKFNLEVKEKLRNFNIKSH